LLSNLVVFMIAPHLKFSSSTPVSGVWFSLAFNADDIRYCRFASLEAMTCKYSWWAVFSLKFSLYRWYFCFPVEHSSFFYHFCIFFSSDFMHLCFLLPGLDNLCLCLHSRVPLPLWNWETGSGACQSWDWYT